MFCPKCGASLPENTNFCNNCGSPVPKQAPPSYGGYGGPSYGNPTGNGYSSAGQAPRFCPRCGTKVAAHERFCSSCGLPQQGASAPNNPQAAWGAPAQPASGLICSSCGAPIQEGEVLCWECGKYVSLDKKMGSFGLWWWRPSRCLPAFILGLIASILGIFGGLCTTMCSSFYGRGEEALFFIFGGSIVGLIGACVCIGKHPRARVGAFEMMGAALMQIFAMYFLGTGGTLDAIFSMVLFIAAAVVGAICSFGKKR